MCVDVVTVVVLVLVLVVIMCVDVVTVVVLVLVLVVIMCVDVVTVEKVLEVYIGPYFKGGIEAWAPYMLSILFLLYRPEGLFGEKIIRRV